MAALLLGSAALVAGCIEPEMTVVGIVIGVDSPSIGSVTGVTLRTSDGMVEHFDVSRLDPHNGLPAVHLREHLASGVPIVLEYVVENGNNVGLRYNDAPVPSSPAPT
jgi:hypothetical protein